MTWKNLLLTVAICGVSTTLIAQEAPEPNSQAAVHEDLDALLWIQTSAEYEAIARQTFRLAQMNLGDALVDCSWTASIEQQKMFADKPDQLAALPPAIIVDVDETVLDNSSYQTNLIKTETEYDRETWKVYVRQKVSLAVPGAKEFVDACHAARVRVLFVTNREHEVEDATRRNLIQVGLMREDDPDLVYTKYEQEEWTSDKQTRREHLASQYRILLLLGDDLNDFVTIGHHPESAQRKATATAYAAWWGKKWIALPNPNYGGWERSVYEWNDASSRATRLKLKREKMRD